MTELLLQPSEDTDQWLAFVVESDFACDLVDPGDVHTEVRQAGSGHQTDIAAANDTDVHEWTLISKSGIG